GPTYRGAFVCVKPIAAEGIGALPELIQLQRFANLFTSSSTPPPHQTRRHCPAAEQTAQVRPRGAGGVPLFRCHRYGQSGRPLLLVPQEERDRERQG
ncbi:unnamed protein product, partial [Lampetra planeri]